MAYTSTPGTTRGFFFAPVLASIKNGFVLFGKALMVSSSGHARLEQVRKLQAKSDEELATMGIERDRIVQIVFRDVFYV